MTTTCCYSQLRDACPKCQLAAEPDTVLELPVNLRYVHRVRLQLSRDDREKVLAYDKDDLLISV